MLLQRRPSFFALSATPHVERSCPSPPFTLWLIRWGPRAVGAWLTGTSDERLSVAALLVFSSNSLRLGRNTCTEFIIPVKMSAFPCLVLLQSFPSYFGVRKQPVQYDNSVRITHWNHYSVTSTVIMPYQVTVLVLLNRSDPVFQHCTTSKCSPWCFQSIKSTNCGIKYKTESILWYCIFEPFLINYVQWGGGHKVTVKWSCKIYAVE